MFDEKELALRIAKKRRSFLIEFIIDILVLIGGAVFLVLDINNSLFFRGIIIIVFALLFLWRILDKYAPLVLFSREIKGKNIKENIYEVYVRRGVALAPKQAGMGYGGRPLSHTRMAKASLRSAVYLKLDNGDVKEIRNMRVEHIELYEDGDTLFKPAGAKFPMIAGRETERQVCPLCGTINAVKDGACLTCGLQMENINA